MNPRILPLLGFLVLFGILGFGLWYVRDHDINEVPSPLVGKVAPAYTLPELYAPGNRFSDKQLAGNPYLLHVFASWCFVCQSENPVLIAHGKSLGIPLIGFDYKDEPEDAKQWLKQFGNPYDTVITDVSGDTGIDFGVYGAPESFIIDGRGVIRYKHVGTLTTDVIQSDLLPLIRKIRLESSR